VLHQPRHRADEALREARHVGPTRCPRRHPRRDPSA
jgi:hypothetical protein